MRITLTVSSLQCGGAERVASQMAEYWARKGWEITVVCLEKGSPFYKLDPRVAVVALPDPPAPGVIEKARRLVRRVGALRRAIAASRPERVISHGEFMSVLTYAALRGGVPQIAMEHTVDQDRGVSTMLRLVRNLVYARLPRVVVLNDEIRRSLDRWCKSDCIRVIPNTVEIPAGDPRPIGVRPKRIIAMGRLAPQKGFDLLIRAFAPIASRLSDWEIDIWGEGPLQAELTALRDALGLSDRIHFRGLTPDPGAAFAEAQLMVLSSRWESFGNVLVEAMARGTPVLSFDCPSGPRTIIRHGVDGLLVPAENVEALGREIERVLTDQPLRELLGANGRAAVERFSDTRVMERWEQALQF